MAAIMLQGEHEKYIFSVLEKGKNFPSCSGFYLLIESEDEYGIRDKNVLAVGHSHNLDEDKPALDRDYFGYTHAYMMPDYERIPQEVLADLEKALESWQEEQQPADAITGSDPSSLQV